MSEIDFKGHDLHVASWSGMTWTSCQDIIFGNMSAMSKIIISRHELNVYTEDME